MRDRLATIDMGRKLEEGCALLRAAGSPSNTVTHCGLHTSYLHIKWHLDPFSRLATIDVGRKVGGGLLWPVVPFLGRGLLGPQLTKCRLGRGLPPYQVAFDPSSRLATTVMGRKLGKAVPLWGRGSWVSI